MSDCRFRDRPCSGRILHAASNPRDLITSAAVLLILLCAAFPAAVRAGDTVACCVADGGCVDATTQDCADLGGTPTGAPECLEPQACCHAADDCRNLDPGCCELMGGLPNEDVCETEIQACCLEDGNCRMMTLRCCQRLFGIPFPGVCGQRQACCRFPGECFDLHPLCCQDAAGTSQGDGTTCAVDGCPPPPFVVHGEGLPGETRPCSGYIDPRGESSNGVDLDRGISEITIVFSEPVFATFGGGGGPLTTSNFAVGETGGGVPPVTASIDATNNPEIKVTLDRPITPGEWTTIFAIVQNESGVRIENLGDLGAVDEPDRVDIGFLPCDVDQDGAVSPFDLLRFRQLVNEIVSPACGQIEDYTDMNRNLDVDPFDLLVFRSLVHGVSPPATRAWAGEALSGPRP